MIFAGPIGTGKTHLAIALDIAPTYGKLRARASRATDDKPGRLHNAEFPHPSYRLRNGLILTRRRLVTSLAYSAGCKRVGRYRLTTLVAFDRVRPEAEVVVGGRFAGDAVTATIGV